MAVGQEQGAAILDNFFPSSTTVTLRRGKELYATLGFGDKPVTSMFTYVNGNNRKMFASTGDTVYNITEIEVPYNWQIVDSDGNTIVDDYGNYFGSLSTVGLEAYKNTNGGEWSVVQFATTGGVYLVGVNGASTGFVYDGADFWPYQDGGVWKLQFNTMTSAFKVGEVVTGGTSGKSGTIYKIKMEGANIGHLYLTGTNANGFTAGENLTGDKGGAAKVTAASTNVVPGVKFDRGLTTADMSYVWVYKNRLWFVQKDSQNVWYMDNVDSIGGKPDIYTLGGIYSLGGSVLWGAPWALSSGAQGGLSDQVVITSSEGEVAVFQGTHPKDGGWVHVGAYRIGKPMGKRAHFRGGGDIAVITSVGLIPLSKAISLDVTALTPAAVSYNIQDAWRQATMERGMEGWEAQLWPERKMAVISPPSATGRYDPILFVANTETGAWCRFTNWDARAMCVFNGQLYFGGAEGKVYKAYVSGKDDDTVYTGVYMPLYEDLDSPANIKVPKLGRAVVRGRAKINYSLNFMSDYNLKIPPAPSAVAVENSNIWGGGTWGKSVWGNPVPTTITDDWKSLAGMGYSCSLAFQMTSGAVLAIDAEIIRLEMSFTMGEIVS